MKHVSCTADNGVGEAAEAAKVVTVRRPPVVTAPMLTSVTVDNVDIVWITWILCRYLGYRSLLMLSPISG